MNWNKLLSDKRFGMEQYHEERKQERTDFQRDYDRLIFSAPFRRLQNKTQVFPLPGSVFVHNRLTHSLEVACVGRSLGDKVGRELFLKYGSENQSLWQIGSIVSAACLAHDLGNPPFGHSGEKAISTYFSESKGAHFIEKIKHEGTRFSDFLQFEGNANSFRLLTHQFKGRRAGGYAMTYSTLASIVKYPYASTLAGEKGKFGFFSSEEEGYKKIAGELGIIRQNENPVQFCRYPLVYLVEAADDICYQVMDIEDAYKLKIISINECKELLFGFFSPNKLDRIKKVMDMVSDENEQIAYLRSSVIGKLVDECADAFLSNETEILQGNFTSTLIKRVDEQVAKAYKICEDLSFRKIYRSQDVLDVELAGYRIINFLLDCLLDAVENPKNAYSKLLINRIPEQYEIDSEDTYTKVQSIIDYISGMTDVYALDLYRKITGMNLPTL